MKITQLKNENIVTTKQIQENYKEAWIDLDERFFDFFVLRDVIDTLKDKIENIKDNPLVQEDAEYILFTIDECFPVFKKDAVKP